MTSDLPTAEWCRKLADKLEWEGSRDFDAEDCAKLGSSLRIAARVLDNHAIEDVITNFSLQPVAWRREWNFRGMPCEVEFTHCPDIAELWSGHPQTDRVIPLYEVSSLNELSNAIANAILDYLKGGA